MTAGGTWREEIGCERNLCGT